MKKTLFIILTVVTTNMFAQKPVYQNVAIKGMTYKFESKATHGMRLTDAVRKRLSENEQFVTLENNELTVHFVHNRWELTNYEMRRIDDYMTPDFNKVIINHPDLSKSKTLKKDAYLLNKRIGSLINYFVNLGFDENHIEINVDDNVNDGFLIIFK